MTEIYFVRHGETELNRLHIVQGQTDTHGLNDLGKAQAQKLVEFAKSQGLRGDALLSSTLRRAVETAQPLADLFGLDIQQDPRLREMYFAGCEGMATATVRALTFDPPWTCVMPNGAILEIPTGEMLRTYHGSNDPMYDNLAHPGGETKAQVRERACNAVFSFLKDNADTKHLWVVCHGGVLRFIRGKFAPPEERLRGDVKNASILHFTWNAATPEELMWRSETEIGE